MDLLLKKAAIAITAYSINSAMVRRLAPRHSPSIPPRFATKYVMSNPVQVDCLETKHGGYNM